MEKNEVQKDFECSLIALVKRKNHTGKSVLKEAIEDLYNNQIIPLLILKEDSQLYKKMASLSKDKENIEAILLTIKYFKNFKA